MSNISYSLYSTNNTVKTDVVTATELVVNSFFLPLSILYFIIIFVLFKYPKDFNSSYYTLLKTLAVGDQVTVIFQWHVFAARCIGVYVLGPVFGRLFKLAAIRCIFCSQYFLHFFLGTNRFCAIVYFNRYQQIFREKLVISLVLVAEVVGVLYSLPYLCICGVTYKPLIVPYNPTEQLTNCAPNVETIYLYLNIFGIVANFGVMLILYAIAATISIINLKLYSSDSRVSYVREMKMMCQGLMLALIVGCTLLSFEIQSFSNWFKMVRNIYPSVNSVVYLMFDPKLRSCLFNLFFCKRCASPRIGPTTAAGSGRSTTM